VIYNHNTYISHSRTIINRNNFNRGRGNFNHGNFNHGNAFTEADLAAEIRGSTGLRLLTFSQEHAPARSAVLITVEMSEAFPPAGGRALEVALTAAVFTAAVDDIGDRMHTQLELVENSRMERNIMPQRNLNSVRLEWKYFARLAVLALFALSLGCSFAPTFAQQPGQRTFASAEDAASALFAAMHGQDEDSSLSILGPAGKDVISSGDPVEDSDTRAGFVVKYQEMHRFVTEPNGAITLVVGAEKLAVSDSLGKEQRLVVFRHRRGQRRDPIPAHWQK